MIDTRKGRIEERARIKKNKETPDPRTVRVVISPKVSIYIKPTDDPAERKRMFLERLQSQSDNLKF